MTRKTGLIILDGWGIRQKDQYNAVALAKTPNFDGLTEQFPHLLLEASGEAVGLPDRQMGNSEVGHLNIGAGRIMPQSLLLINRSIKQNTFSDNLVICQMLKECVEKQSTLHLVGLLSDGGVHSHQEHLFALIRLAHQFGLKNIRIHIITDGRDTAPKHCLKSIQACQSLLESLRTGTIATVCGRYYAMDRNQQWDRTKKTYELIAYGRSHSTYESESAISAIQQAYNRGETDEFIKPTAINGGTQIKQNDTMIMMNFRKDRMLQLTAAFTQPEFQHFETRYQPKVYTLTPYHIDANIPAAFTHGTLVNGLGEYISKQNISQLRISETEKHPHVTYFFNGGIDICYPKEHRELLLSPNVTTYDLKPEMSCKPITNSLLQWMQKTDIQLFVCNFANADMVGHCGDLATTIQAVEAVDEQLGRICHTAKRLNWNLLITADHGNADIMYDEQTQQPHTAHTLSPVPCIFISDKKNLSIRKEGTLSDIAPSILKLMNLDIPEEMTGRSLFL